MDDLIRIPSDPERARSPLDMAGIRKEATAILKDADPQRFASLIVEEYYELLLELITALLAIAGLRPRPKLPAAHQVSIAYLRQVPEMAGDEIQLIDDLREERNRIKYYGRQIAPDFLAQKEKRVLRAIAKLRRLVTQKLGTR